MSVIREPSRDFIRLTMKYSEQTNEHTDINSNGNSCLHPAKKCLLKDGNNQENSMSYDTFRNDAWKSEKRISFELNSKEQCSFERKSKDLCSFEPKPIEQCGFELKPKEQCSFELKPREQCSFELKTREQCSFELKPRDLFSIESKSKENCASGYINPICPCCKPLDFPSDKCRELYEQALKKGRRGVVLSLEIDQTTSYVTTLSSDEHLKFRFQMPNSRQAR